MKPEIEKVEIYQDTEKGMFELKLDGKEIHGVKGYELKSLDNGEPELKLILNVKDFTVDLG